MNLIHLLFQGRGWAHQEGVGLMIGLIVLIGFIIIQVIKNHAENVDSKSIERKQQHHAGIVRNYFWINKWQVQVNRDDENIENTVFVKEHNDGKIYVFKYKANETLEVIYLDRHDKIQKEKIKIDSKTEKNIRFYID